MKDLTKLEIFTLHAMQGIAANGSLIEQLNIAGKGRMPEGMSIPELAVAMAKGTLAILELEPENKLIPFREIPESPF
jgi:hypothetical protein